MNIEESVKKNPEKFEKVFNGKKDDVAFAVKDLSQKLDIVIWGAMNEYAKEENVDANLTDIKTYKTLNKIVTKKIDEILNELLLEKRKLVQA